MTKQFEQFVTQVTGVKLPPYMQELIKKMNAMPKGSSYHLICARPNAKRYLEKAIAEMAKKTGVPPTIRFGTTHVTELPDDYKGLSDIRITRDGENIIIAHPVRTPRKYIIKLQKWEEIAIR